MSTDANAANNAAQPTQPTVQPAVNAAPVQPITQQPAVTTQPAQAAAAPVQQAVDAGTGALQPFDVNAFFGNMTGKGLFENSGNIMTMKDGLAKLVGVSLDQSRSGNPMIVLQLRSVLRKPRSNQRILCASEPFLSCW